MVPTSFLLAATNLFSGLQLLFLQPPFFANDHVDVQKMIEKLNRLEDKFEKMENKETKN